jgi:hypothetical protein
MKRSLLSLAALACLGLGLQAIAANAAAADNTARSGGAAPAASQRVPAQGSGLPSAQGIVLPSAQQPSVPTFAPPPPMLATAKFLKSEINFGEWAEMKFDGISLAQGSNCIAIVSWGDGTASELEVGKNMLWGSTKKSYQKPDTYTATVKVKPGQACKNNGPISETIKVKPVTILPPSQLSKLEVVQNGNPMGRYITVSWTGIAPEAQCRYRLEFGDGTNVSTSAGAAQREWTTSHVFPHAPYTYTVSVVPTIASDSCSLGPDAGPKTFTLN